MFVYCVVVMHLVDHQKHIIKTIREQANFISEIHEFSNQLKQSRHLKPINLS